ncbi:MAG: hypothetical protein H6Q72_4336 [Firmicutes bacterium]|nr:hypothetical protein [Bacillota bacterium]
MLPARETWGEGVEILEQCIEEAVEEFMYGGLYCSEAILKAFSENLDLGLPPELYKIASGFAVGLGGAKCCCGCITGSAMVLSLATGRNSADESEELVFSMTKQLHDEFKKRFKATCCRVLTKKGENVPEDHIALCAKYVRGAAEITANLLKNQLKQCPKGNESPG